MTKGRPYVRSINPADCPAFHDHTPCPSGYMEWHDWAARMGRTHRQIRCTSCGLYAIWLPKAARDDEQKAHSGGDNG